MKSARLTLILHGLDKLFTSPRGWIDTVVAIDKSRATTREIELLDNSVS